MKRTLLATAAAVALIAGPALAQKLEAPANKSEAANPAPRSMQNAPAEKSEPAGKAMPDRAAEQDKARPQTTGQASPKMDDGKGKADMKPDSKGTTGQGTTGQATPGSQPGQQQQPRASEPPRGGNQATQPGAQPQPNAQSQPGGQQRNQGAQAPAQQSGSTTAQGSAGSQGASVSLTTEQKTKIRTTVLQGSSAPRVSNVNFSINVGTVVPRAVKVVAVPPTLVEIHPAWRGYMYFVHGDEIIIVEPRTLKIVAVIAV